MEQTDKDLGKVLIDNYYKVGNWYRFKVYLGGDSFKIMKITKIQKKSDRYFLKGIGFTVYKNALLNPFTSKDESVLFCWAEENIKYNIQYTEDEVKKIFAEAASKSQENLFSQNVEFLEINSVL